MNIQAQNNNAQARLLSDRGWWHGAVIYQIYPRSFMDTNGDGVGDLQGIINGLDHVASLGVDGVWLSPFFTSPMKDFGYDIADYLDVDPLFGSLDDFDRLIKRAHELSLKVIIDQVYSHTSDQHAWFKESRKSRDNSKADWYVWADPCMDGTPPSNWQSVFGGPAWEWDNARGQYYLHNFLTSQPDLNVHNPEVQEAVLDAVQFWLDRGVDGFRLDALNFSMHDLEFRNNPPAPRDGRPMTRPFDFQEHKYNQSHPDIPKFLERVRAVLDKKGGIFTVAEVGGPTPLAEMKAFTEGESRLNSAYDFSFLYAPELKPETVLKGLDGWTGAEGEGWPSWAFSNHDAPRAVSRWASEDQRDQAARLHMLVLMALRGNVFIYQGEELGLPAAHVPFEDLQDPEAIANWPHTLGRDSARTPLPWNDSPLAGFTTAKPWLPIDERHRELSISRQQLDPASMLAFTRQLIGLRRVTPTLKWGALSEETACGEVLSFNREHEGERLICVFNLSTDASAKLPLELPNGKIVVSVGLGAKTINGPLPPLSGFIWKTG